MEDTDGMLINYAIRTEEFNKLLSLKDRNYQISLHVFDLIGLSSLRPTESVWSNFTVEKLSGNEEATLFEMLIEYCLSSVMEKYTRGIEILLEDIKSYLFTRLRLTPTGYAYKDSIDPDIYRYIATLTGRLNNLTFNLLNGLTHVDRLNPYENNGSYVINDITIDIKNNVFFGTLEILVAKRVENYGE